MDFLQFKESLLEKLEQVEHDLSNPEITSIPENLQKYGQEHTRLTELKELFASYEKALADLSFLDEMSAQKEISEEEYVPMKSELELSIKGYEFDILKKLVPADELDNRNIIIEVRAGAGGDEASLFGGELMRMYMRYAERKNWKYELLDIAENGVHGIKTAIFKIRGKEVFGRLKYESGVHRVQRVPETEASGRIHTSTATVAVLPEVTDIDVVIDPKDLRIDTYRAGGAGGQYVNKTESAVRVTHIPTGIVVACQNERDQHQNKEVAMNILRAKLFESKLMEQQKQMTDARRSQIGSGDRSEKIRTYNFPQNRVTDHRIGFTTYRINEIIDGDLDELIDKLIEFDLNEKLEKIKI